MNLLPHEETAALAIDEAEARRYNPPGQSTLVYRVGTYARFVQHMLDLVPRVTLPDGPNRGKRPLQNFNASAQHDWIVAILKSWAMVGDVLAFYQERIANEGYLRTATEYRSVLELVHTIGYKIRPGAAARADLVFTLLDAPGTPDQVIVPVGTSVQSTPDPGQLPVTFETSEEIVARPDFNALVPYVPALSRPIELGPGARDVRIKGIRPGLQTGLPLLIVGTSQSGAPPDAVRYVRILQSVEADRAGGSTRLTWDEPLDGVGPLIDPRVFVLRQHAALFGHDAPAWSDLPTETKETYATRQGGVLGSTDGGATWQPANRGLPGTTIAALAVDRRGQSFAGTPDGLYRTTDGGQTWEAVSGGLTKKDVLCLTVADDGYLFAGTSSGEVYRSTDSGASWDLLRGGILFDRGGRSWKPVNARLPKTVIRSVLSIRTSDGQSYVFAGTDRGVIRSTDGGNAWLAANRGLPGRDPSTGLAGVVVHALTMDGASNVLLIGTDRGVFASRNRGQSWKPVNRGLPNADLASPSLIERIRTAIARLFHHGSPPRVGSPRGIVVYALLAYENPSDRQHYLFAGTDQGIFVSTNDGDLWRPAGQGMQTTVNSTAAPVVRAIAISRDPTTHAARLFAGTDRGVFHSNDLGATWTFASGGDVRAMTVDANGPIWAATPPDGFTESEWPGFRIAGNTIDLDRTYSRVLEGSWVVLQQSQPTPLTGAFPVRDVATVTRAEFSRRGTITRITTDPDHLLTRFDLRETAVFVGSEQLDLQDVQSPWLEPIQGNTIHLAGVVSDLPSGKMISVVGHRLRARLIADLGGVFQSAEPTWQSVGLIGHSVQVLLVDREGGLLAGAADGLYRQVGASWESLGAPVTNIHALTVLGATDLIVGTADGVCRRSGTSWSHIGLVGQTVRALAVDPRGRLWAGTRSGVFRLGASTWESGGLVDQEVLSLLVDADGRLVAATADGVFVARGRNWIGVGPPGRDARCLTLDGQGRLVVGTSDGVFRQAGESWDMIGLGRQTIQTVAVDDHDNLYAGIAGDGLWTWCTSGKTWTRVPIGASNDVRALAIDRAGRVIAATGNATIVASPDHKDLSPWTHEPLFELVADTRSQSDLDRGIVPKTVRSALTGHGISLSGTATLAVVRKGSRWLLSDRDAAFLIRYLPEGLQVCPSQSLVLLSTPEPDPGQPSLRRWSLLDGGGGEGTIVALVDDFSLDRSRPEDSSVGETGRIQCVTIAPGRDHSTITLEGALRRSYDPFATTISANVVPATHGETVRYEVIGSGDSSKANQSFTLKKPPLTYLAAATPSGVESTLSIYVHPALSRQMIPIPGLTPSVSLGDAIQWHEVPSLYQANARDPVYMARSDDEGRTSIIFGDGEHGMRLPSGMENVIAAYRTGLGPTGNVDAERLTTLKSRPPGIRRVTNPVPASGGVAPENADQARARAPATTRTLGRIVSLRDFEDFASAFAGISKAQVRRLDNETERLIHLTLAGENGARIDRSSGLYAALVEAIERYRVPGPRVSIDSYEPVFFNLDATVRVDPDHVTEAVLASVEQTVTATFQFARRQFGQNVTASDAVTLIQGVTGVRAVRLDALYPVTGRREVAAVLRAEPARWEADTIAPAQIILLDGVGKVQVSAETT